MIGLRRVHPFAAALYLAVMIFFAMASLNPVTCGIMLFLGGALYGLLKGGITLLKSLRWSLPLMLLMTILNPLFVHRGATPLFFINGSPITLEALAYGGVSAMMLGSVYYWFACLSEIINDDKTVYLLGRRFPRMALVLSMTLNLVPRLKNCAVDIDDAQRALGVYDGEGIASKIKSKLNVFSVLVSQSLEGSIDTADAMEARGYSLPGRHSYGRYVFTCRDGLLCAFTAATAALALLMRIRGVGGFDFYPWLSKLTFSPNDIIYYALPVLLAFYSIIPEVGEKIKWRCLK